MAQKVLLRDVNKNEILPITRGELVLDSSGKQALHSDEFLATTSQPGLMSKEDKYKIDNISISTLEITDLLPNGKKIATVSVGSTSYNILAPASYDWNEVNNKPTNLSQFTDDVVAGKYLPLSGGTLTNSGGFLKINRTDGNPIIWYQYNGSNLGYIGFNTDAEAVVMSKNDNVLRKLIHSGNIGSYNAGSATKLATARTIWGQSFDGTGNISGNLTSNIWRIAADANYDATFIQSQNYDATSNNGTIIVSGWNGSSLQSFGVWAAKCYFNGNVGFGATNPSEKIEVRGNVKASSFVGNLDGQYVNKLTNYTKATTIAAIATTDSLNTALGKLELKADSAYELVKGAYDGDGAIENLAEILKVLEGIKDTETIQAIVGKYLPLAGGTIYNSNVATPLYIKGSGTSAYIGFQDKDTKNMGFIGMTGENSLKFCKSNGATSYDILHSGNASINNGTITINGISITPITSHQDLSNYRRLDITQMFNSEISSQYHIARCKEGGGGWAYSPYVVYKGDKTTLLSNIGVYGGGNVLTYSYFGSNDWNGANLRVYPAGNIYCVGAEINGHTSMKGASIAGYASSGSISKVKDLGDQGVSVGFNTRESWGTVMWVEGNGKGYIQQQAFTDAATTYALCLQPFGGSVGIGTNNPTTLLEVAGDILSKGYYLKEASTVTPVNMFGWYIWQNTVQFTKRNTNNAYVKELLGINMTTETTTVTGTFKVSGNSTITGNLNIDGGADTYRKISIGSETSGRHVVIHNSAGFTIDGTSAGRIAELSLYESSSRLGGIGVYSGGPIYIDSSAGVHKIALENLTTITKTLTVTKDWMDTGIKYTDLTTGTYIVQVCMSNASTIYDAYWSGVMTWYGSVTNGVDSDEILLHRGSHACNDRTIYLRTINSYREAGTNMRLQIAASKALTSASYTFKFKKLI